MLRRFALTLNVLVILSGVGFVLYGLHLGASLALLAGGLNLLMLRPPDRQKMALLPIAFNILVMSIGFQGAVLGAAYLYGRPQEGADLQAQRQTGLALLILCPIFFTAGLVASIEFFRRTMNAKRGQP